MKLLKDICGTLNFKCYTFNESKNMFICLNSKKINIMHIDRICNSELKILTASLRLNRIKYEVDENQNVIINGTIDD